MTLALLSFLPGCDSQAKSANPQPSQSSSNVSSDASSPAFTIVLRWQQLVLRRSSIDVLEFGVSEGSLKAEFQRSVLVNPRGCSTSGPNGMVPVPIYSQPLREAGSSQAPDGHEPLNGR